jgi:hypothetical protein
VGRVEECGLRAGRWLGKKSCFDARQRTARDGGKFCDGER